MLDMRQYPRFPLPFSRSKDDRTGSRSSYEVDDQGERTVVSNTMSETPPSELTQPLTKTPSLRSPASDALLSMLLPGLGQLAQRRPGTALLQFTTVAAYLGGALAVGTTHALWFAALWNGWSAIDAYWHARR